MKAISYEPAYIIFYTIFLIIIYVLTFVLFLSDKNYKLTSKSILYLVISVICILVGLFYEGALGFFIDEIELTGEYYVVGGRTMLHLDFIIICLPSYVFLIISRLMMKKKTN